MADQGIESLVGRLLIHVEVVGDNQELLFRCMDGAVYRMHHRQDCCESCNLVEIVGDLRDLHGLVVEAYEASSEGVPPPADSYEPESYTWTFYVLCTNKGTVTFRWYGTSNGYYSERAHFERVDN